MKKRLLLISFIFFVINAAYAQNSASPVAQMDDAVKELAQNIHKKLVEGNAQKVMLGQFSYRGTVPSFSNYWKNQLVGELSNITGRPYAILSDGAAGADRIISGEIVDVTNIIRVYSRLIRSEDRTVETMFQSDFERTAALNPMFVSSSGSGSSSAFPDEYEPDSWDNPVPYEITIDENAPTMNRTFHDENDEDFFLLIPERSARLTMETTGNLDTYMHLYNYDTKEQIAQNDDGGQNANARIRYNVQAGNRYLVMIRELDRTGNYGFRAYMAAPREGANSWETPLSYQPGTDENEAIINRSFAESGDEDFFLIVPDRDGRMVMETTGRMDTYMHLYNYDTKEQIAQDDDGGQNANARIRYNVQAGNRYLVKVRDLDEGTGNYGFRAYVTAPREGGDSWENPLVYAPGADENAVVMDCSFERRGENNFFLIVPDRDGRLTVETTGRMDTYMHLYNYDTKELLEDDDDSGQNYNARIRYNVQAGNRYLVRIRELDDDTGSYGFRAYISQ